MDFSVNAHVALTRLGLVVSDAKTTYPVSGDLSVMTHLVQAHSLMVGYNKLVSTCTLVRATSVSSRENMVTVLQVTVFLFSVNTFCLDFKISQCCLGWS